MVEGPKRVGALPILIAFKVIALAEDLSAVERQVGATLLDSFNRKTGQCDPSLDRVAGLLNVHRRTVIRATAKLEAKGLFRKTRHGGYSHRNHYEPVWLKFRDLEAKWRIRFEAAAVARRSGLSYSAGHGSHNAGDVGATQTCCPNQSKLTLPESRINGSIGPHAELRESKRSSMKVQRPAPPNPTGTRALSRRSAEAARAAAERRWSDNLRYELSNQVVVYGELVDFIDEPLRSAATDAELSCRGGGLKLIWERYRDSEQSKGSANG
jgi:predicted transcriptional regulator